MTVKETKDEIFEKWNNTPGFVGAGIGLNDTIHVYWENEESIDTSIDSSYPEYTFEHIVTGKIELQ